MTSRRALSPTRHWVIFGLIALSILAALAIYAVNMVRWANGPDFGWRTMYSYGPNVVGQVFERGEQAGLRFGDRILAINGRAYTTFDELFFQDPRHGEPGSVNIYTVLREGQRIDIPVTTGRIGAAAVFMRSGIFFVLGVVYILIGVLVYLMKPRAAESWLFLVMVSLFGLRVIYTGPTDLIRPTWLYDLRFFFSVASSASLTHLALLFPKTHSAVLRRPWLSGAAYLPVLLLFGVFKWTSSAYWNMPSGILLLVLLYTMGAILFFLGCMIWNLLRDPSIIIRLQSRVIFVGILLSFFIPIVDLVARSVWHVYVFPEAVSFAAFFSLFPLSIGYTIVKHDLFAIDTIVRRTYGYVLSTGTVVGAYAVIVSLLNVIFQGSDVARSPVFSIGFALLVVFLFQPMHTRFQGFVDRVFYRQRYDYRKTIRDLSEAMTSILDPDLIARSLIGSVVKEMFLENGALLLRDTGGRSYQVRMVEGMDTRTLPASELAEGDAVLGVISERKEVLLRHDVIMNPAYEATREDLERTFQSLSSELMLPMIYKDELRGIISLGRKKSGKLFTPEDLDLLRTLTSQSAIALENAHLFKENLQKGRMEEELKIAHDIQMGMIPDGAPRVPGFQIAARTIPAREVGGDFYDFVELPGNGAGARLGIVIADVSGKGVSAGLLMAGARSTYRVLLDANPSVTEVMTLANQRLKRDIRKGMFVALLYAVLDPGKRTLALSNAGQTQPVLCAPGADPAHITTEGDTYPLGIVADCDYQETTLSLAQGSVVVFYTDGVVEAMNATEELYGFDRFLESVGAARELDAPALLENLLGDIERFVGGTEQHDDTTIIVVKVE